ncbi:hypothetical protein BpJC7_12540 [Weizmannia acidilactici]|uniref:Uncharacterized protein n=1 Tax=Weizmannia acidilactici TaxID=2607726 RepID=A0A5J4JE19_9BACI|nr:hypothetical protein BpJC7_12540 [Weizmannia acidilactici]GER73116.1 hypothetical protein BpPP18_11830 [Weizmannia acidilactici]
MKERFVHVTGGRVYYKKTSTGNKTPLIVLHGGPGGTHMPMLALEALGMNGSSFLRPARFREIGPAP